MLRPMTADPLPSWREASAKRSIAEFAAADQKWTVIDMAADWSVVHPPAV